MSDYTFGFVSHFVETSNMELNSNQIHIFRIINFNYSDQNVEFLNADEEESASK